MVSAVVAVSRSQLADLVRLDYRGERIRVDLTASHPS
jgi:hypothetical protein